VTTSIVWQRGVSSEHEVAYESLLQERRRALHVRIVEAREALAGDRAAEPVDQLAPHALRGEVWILCNGLPFMSS
jgi:hypothetical protein